MTNTVLSTIEIESLVSLIADEVVKKIGKEPIENHDRLLDLSEACEFIRLSKQTVYNKVAKRDIPHQRKNGRLYFSSKELSVWIKSGKRKTNDEIKDDARLYLTNKDLSK